MTEELKPCPFCHSQAHMRPIGPDFGVGCNACGAEAGWEPTEADAITAWNRRATPAPAQPEVHAALRAAGLMLVRTEQGLKVEQSLEAKAEWAEKVRFNDGPTPNDPPFLSGDESAGAAAPAEGAASLREFVEDIARDPDEHPELRQKAREALAAASKEKPLSNNFNPATTERPAP